MALIGKIREKSWLLVAVIGVAMLFFIGGMLGQQGSFIDKMLHGSQEDVVGIGTINGTMVDEDQYNEYLKNARNSIYQNKVQQDPTGQPTFTQQDEKNAEQQAWQTSISVNLMSKEYKNIGLVVDDYELDNVLYGENGYTPSSFSEQFKDSTTGEFAPEQMRQALNQLQDANEEEQVKRYHNIINYVRQERLQQKYSTLLGAGFHTTTLEGKDEYQAKKTVKNVTYVYQSFTKVPNEAVGEPTEEELQKYFDAHKNEQQYEQKAKREVSYFAIPISPSQNDSTKALDLIKKYIPKFKASDKDSLFVLRFSDIKYYSNDSTAVASPENSLIQGAKYPTSVAGVMDSAKIGDVVGPYFTNNGAVISKIIGSKDIETASVRHILLKTSGPEETEVAQKKADSIIEVIRDQHNFKEMVTEFSDDQASVGNGGKYENFPKGVMVPEFTDFSFNKPVGTIGTVKTDYGIHIVEVLGHKTTKYPKLANIVRNVKVSRTTSDQVKSIASNYIFELDDQFENKTTEEKNSIFDSIANKNGFAVKKVSSPDNNPTINGGFSDGAKRGVLRLAYDENAQIGDITPSPIHDNNTFIVGFISGMTKDGVPQLKDVKNKIAAEIRKEGQAQYLIDKMTGKKDLQKLANELGAQLETEGLTFSASNASVGREPQIIGAAFSGLADGETTVPIKGSNGVFVLKVDQTTPAPETTDYSAEKEQLESQNKAKLKSQYSAALLKSADVYDNRALRRYGIK